MLKVSGLSKAYGGEQVLWDVSFVLNPGERVGLVGPNASGKSTLLRLLAGEIQPDGGSVWLSPGERVAYLPQYPLDDLDLTLRQALRRGMGRVGELEERVAALEHAMRDAEGTELEGLLSEYAEAREGFEQLGGYEMEARMQEVTAGLGLDATDLSRPVRTLSGGNKTKLSLARLLLSVADVLLLDEPTNYLDLRSLLWLERFVAQGRGSYIIVSHDRRFLDRTVSGILELETETHTLRRWPGNYSVFTEARLRERQKLLEAYRDQQAEIARLEEDIRRTREQAQSTERQTQNDYIRARSKKVAAKAKAREHRLERVLESSNMIEKPKRGWGLHLVDLGRRTVQDDRLVVEMDQVRAGYDGREVLRGVSLELRGRDRLALLGENGSGKSTMLRCLTGELGYEGRIRIGASVQMGVLSQEVDTLPAARTVLQVFRDHTEMYEDEARTYLHRFLFTGDEVHKPVGALSYGQQQKLALAVLVLSHADFLVLDEPTSHMDMPALEAVEEALASFRGPLLLVSHDRYFIERVGINRFALMEGGGLHAVESMEGYEEEML